MSVGGPSNHGSTPSSRRRSPPSSRDRSASNTAPVTPSSSTPALFNPGQSPNIIFSRPRAPSPYMKALLAYIDAVNSRDFEKMEAVFDEALEHRILPKSLERPVLTKRLYGEYWRGVMSLFESFETRVIEVIEAGEKMTVHASSNGVSLTGTPYRNEYVLMIHFTSPIPEGEGEEALPRMRYLKEFVDSEFSVRFFKEERERQRKKRQAEEEEAARAEVGVGVMSVDGILGES